MPADRFKKQWRYPDHHTWVHARINSHNKKNFLRDLELVLTRCGVVDRFKEGPFGKYLEIPQPIKVHGMLIYNLLKREIIRPNSQNEDEIWFGLGQKEARFGREEFCLCSGLNMGTLPEGFRERAEVCEKSIFTRHFADESPTIELLEAVFNRLTEPESGDDALKMAYLLFVSQFFGIDEARTAIPGWLFSLVEDIDAFESFPWGSYIFDVTLFWLKNAADKHLYRLRGGDGQKKEENEEKNKKKKEENKKRKKKEDKEEKEEEKKKKKKQKPQPKKKKQKTEVEDGEDGEEETDNDNQQNNKEAPKYFTFHTYGFLLAFQVWAVERITRLEGKIGIRKGTGFPRFQNWTFNTRVLKVESYFSTTMALFPWKVYDIEKSSDYYKSLMLEDVVRDDRDDAMAEGDASIHQSKTKTTLRASRNSNEPASKKRLFDGGDVETPKSKSKTSVPYTIPELYTSIKQLVTEQIKESEERMKSWLREEIGKIAKQNKVGDTSTPKQSRESEEKDMDRDDNNRLDESDDGFYEKEVDLDKQETENVGGLEGGLDKEDRQKVVGLEGGLDKEDRQKVVGDQGGLEKEDRENLVGDQGGMEKEDREKLVGEEVGSAKQAIDLEEFPSPSVNMILPNPNDSLIFMEAADPKVCYKNNDMKRARHRSRYLSTPYTDPMPIPKKKKKTQDSAELVNENYNQFMSYLKKKDNTRVYTGQTIEMSREQFKELVKPTKWISNLHIDSYLDVLWKRRSSREDSYPQDIGVVSTAFFNHVNIKWKAAKKLLDSERCLKKFEAADKDRVEEEKNDPPRLKEKEVRTKKKMKKEEIDHTSAVPIWEEYPEFDPLTFQPDEDALEYVSGSELLYIEPWWSMESVLIPCNTGDHWVLCQVYLKEGKVIMYDSLCDRNGKSNRLNDIQGLLYLLPSILKHANYYEQMTMPPHKSPFTAEYINGSMFPQQGDGYSCGAFLLKYAELILSGVELSSWMDSFGQKDVPSFREAMALAIFVNGELEDS